MEWDTGFLVYTSQDLKNWPVTEGPTVLKHKGLYYLIYSANDFRNPDYPFGFVTRQANWALEEFGRQSIHFPRSFGERGLWA
ncbi:hypothetical protein [Pareuzebyella sediminis]|uniref:hypothetical protein n=1 Tax=Pareuzebyella sediminis TaxID=2607998 RepID=UPI0011F08770|nr:hypothetical protein [Pareuzebyella sediminis]